MRRRSLEPTEFEDAEEDLVPRPPVVTIMGHVDHGKTTPLDAIRKASSSRRSRARSRSTSARTRPRSAGRSRSSTRPVTGVPSPRARGAKVTDIAVLVVAADGWRDAADEGVDLARVRPRSRSWSR